jgi:2-oxoglutarate ferredoxin oxidoreductase subunit gamma
MISWAKPEPKVDFSLFLSPSFYLNQRDEGRVQTGWLFIYYLEYVRSLCPEDVVSRRELRIAGFGGQGVVLAGQIIGQAVTVYDKQFAAFTQNYGPEARGGSCTAEVVAGDQPIGYPYLTNPQVVVALSQDAYLKYARSLAPETKLIIDADLVKPDPSQKHPYLAVPANRLARDMGRAVVSNIILLGFLAAVTDFVSVDALRRSVLASVPKGTGELNMKAFETGYQYGLNMTAPHGGAHV